MGENGNTLPLFLMSSGFQFQEVFYYCRILVLLMKKNIINNLKKKTMFVEKFVYL